MLRRFPRHTLHRFFTVYTVYAWAVLGYTVLVILWGAFVRATGSGAGCGSHWPLCDGEVLPRSQTAAMAIELTHRLTSGLALLLVVGLLAGAWLLFPKRHPVRTGAVLSMVFMLTEAAVGAGLVLFGLVAENDSIARGVVISFHLVNTFLLLASIALTAFWASGGSRLRLGKQAPLLGAAMATTLLVGMSGAISALGDTLFPAADLRSAWRQDLSPGSHLFLQLRIFHPALALLSSALLFWVARSLSGVRPLLRRSLVALVALQIAVGVLNVVLLAPIWLQIVHLLLADLVWIQLVLVAAHALGGRATEGAGALRAPGSPHPQPFIAAMRSGWRSSGAKEGRRVTRSTSSP